MFIRPEVKEKRTQPAPWLWLEQSASLPGTLALFHQALVKQTTITPGFPLGTEIEEGGKGTGKNDLTCKIPEFSPTLLFLLYLSVPHHTTPVFVPRFQDRNLQVFLPLTQKLRKKNRERLLWEYRVIRWKVINSVSRRAPFQNMPWPQAQ